MKTKILTRITSGLLSASLLCTPMVLSKTAFALNYEQECKKLNKDGQYEDDTCAILDGKERIKGGESYLKFEKVGRHSDQTLQFFDYRLIKDILSKIGYTKNSREIIKDINLQRKSNNLLISKIILSTGLGVVITKLIRDCYADSQKANASKNAEGIKKSFWTKVKDKLKLMKNNFLSIGNLFFGVCTIILAVLFDFGFRNVNNMISFSKQSKLMDKFRHEKANYFEILDSLLHNIQYGRVEINKIICAHERPNYSHILIYDDNKVEHTETEKAEFQKDLDNLKTQIEEILRENEEHEKAGGPKNKEELEAIIDKVFHELG